MGYTTEFEGRLEVSPPMSSDLVEKINEFCQTRHEEGYDTLPSIWCDFEATATTLSWNGSEKSYSMDEWAQYLIDKFVVPAGHMVNGRMTAFGEDPGDIWILVAKDNKVSRHQGRVEIIEED